MKSRRITVLLEIETELLLSTIKHRDYWQRALEGRPGLEVLQVQANIMQGIYAKKKAKR